MAEKQDIREDQMTEMTNPQKIRCLDSEGNSGLILLSTLLLKTMRNVGYLLGCSVLCSKINSHY